MDEDLFIIDIGDEVDDDERNAPFGLSQFGGQFQNQNRRRRQPSRGRGRGRGRQIVVSGRDRAPVEKKTGGVRLGVLAEVAANAFIALRPSPPVPPVVEKMTDNFTNLYAYHTAVQDQQRQSAQVRTMGLALRAFLK